MCLRDGVGLLDLGLEERVALAELRDLLLDALELGLALLEVDDEEVVVREALALAEARVVGLEGLALRLGLGDAVALAAELLA